MLGKPWKGLLSSLKQRNYSPVSFRSERNDELELQLTDVNGDKLVGLRFVPVRPGTAGSPALNGAMVHSVIKGSPAAEAGIQPRDIVTCINGRPVTTREAAIREFGRAKWPILVRIRGRSSLRGTLRQRSSIRADYEKLVFNIPQPQASSRIGLSFGVHDEADWETAPVLEAVLPDSPAAKAGLCAYDLLLSVNGVRTESEKHALGLLQDATWPKRITVGRPQAYHAAALRLQKFWRKMAHVERIICTRRSPVAPLGITFCKDITATAVVSEVVDATACYGKLRPNHAVLFVNGKLCYNSDHAEQLLQNATGEVELLCMMAGEEQLNMLRALTDVEAREGLSTGATNGTQCTICKQPMGLAVPWIAGCGHKFCGPCTKERRADSNACPICKGSPSRNSGTPVLLRARPT